MSKRKKSRPPVKQSKHLKAPEKSAGQPSVTALEIADGPLPHPRIFREYDKIVPGAAERILNMAERDQENQFKLRRLAAMQYRRGQIFGLIVAVAAFTTSFFALWMGFERAAMVIGGATVVGLVTVFVTGRSGRLPAGRQADPHRT